MSTATVSLPTTVFSADPVHSQASFAVHYMGVSAFKSGFGEVEAQLDARDPSALRLSGRVKVESINISEENFRGHLFSPEFFDSANHPYIEFVSEPFSLAEDNTLVFTGKLNIKGISHEVTGRGTLEPPVTDPYGNTRVGLNAAATIDRYQWEITWNNQLPNGNEALAHEVRLNVDLSLVAEENAG